MALHHASMVVMHLVRPLLASTTAVSARMTVSRGGGGTWARKEESLLVVELNMVQQVLGEKEEG